MIGARFQNGSLMRVKNRTTDDTWFLRFYENVGGRRVYRKQRIGTVRELPTRHYAEKAVLALRAKINSGLGPMGSQEPHLAYFCLDDPMFSEAAAGHPNLDHQNSADLAAF